MWNMATGILTAGMALLALLCGLSFVVMASSGLVMPALVLLGLTLLYSWIAYRSGQLLDA